MILGSQCLIKHHNSLTWQLWLRYGFYVGTVHGAAVLQAGGGDAQGGVVLPGLKGRVRVISSIICPGGTCLLVYSTSSVSDRTSSNVK